MTLKNQHTDLYESEKIQDLERELKAERAENTRLRLRIEELEYMNKKYHRNLQRFAPGQPTVRDY